MFKVILQSCVSASPINRMHITEKAYKCGKCQFETNRGYILSEHTRNGHVNRRERPLYKCKYCSYRGYGKNEFFTHARNEYGNKIRFMCDKPWCSFRTKAKSSIMPCRAFLPTTYDTWPAVSLRGPTTQLLINTPVAGVRVFPSIIICSSPFYVVTPNSSPL